MMRKCNTAHLKERRATVLSYIEIGTLNFEPMSFHGLRKAGYTRPAEVAASEKQISWIVGHASLAEVQRHTKSANQARMARDAMKLP